MKYIVVILSFILLCGCGNNESDTNTKEPTNWDDSNWDNCNWQ